MNQSVIRGAVRAALIAALSFGVGFVAGGSGSAMSAISHLPLVGDGLDATPESSANLTDFWKVWNALSTRFVQTHGSTTLPTTNEAVLGAIMGLTASYKDPYTIFFPPQESKKFQENISGNFGGIGIEIDTKDGVLTVITPLKGTPADIAGIKAGDAIYAIDGKTTEGITTDVAVSRIRGIKGTPVILSISRGGKNPFDVTVVRDTIQVPEIDDGLDAQSGVYHIALYEFTATSADLFNAAFDRFKKSGSHLLVIDVRGNPGGYLESAVDIASHFLPKGATIVTEDHRGKAENETHQSYGYDDAPAGTKIVVLVDQGSASASEILAGALKDNGVATLIGMRSFGKGSIQELIMIGDASLKVTVARWLTPSGISLADGGLTPDIKVELTADDVTAKNDLQMKRAVQFLTTGK